MKNLSVVSEEQKIFLKTFKRNLAVWLAAQLIILVFILIGFYFNTLNRLDENEEDIQHLQKDVEKKIDTRLFYEYKEDQNKKLNNILYDVREIREVVVTKDGEYVYRE